MPLLKRWSVGSATAVAMAAWFALPVTMVAVAVPGGWEWWRVFVATHGVLLVFFAIAVFDSEGRDR